MIGAGNFGKVTLLTFGILAEAALRFAKALSVHVLQVYVGRLNRQHRVAIKTLQSESMPEIHRFEAVRSACKPDW